MQKELTSQDEFGGAGRGCHLCEPLRAANPRSAGVVLKELKGTHKGDKRLSEART